MIIGAGNYEVAFTDVDGKFKKITLFMQDEHINILNSSSFRVITGWEKRGAKSITKIICLSQNQMATLELAS